MDYDKDFGVCPVRQPYADVYTVMKNESHASDLSDSANQGMAVGAKMTCVNVQSLKHELCSSPVSVTYPMHI
jgi:hypothetical protein